MIFDVLSFNVYIYLILRAKCKNWFKQYLFNIIYIVTCNVRIDVQRKVNVINISVSIFLYTKIKLSLTKFFSCHDKYVTYITIITDLRKKKQKKNDQNQTESLNR